MSAAELYLVRHGHIPQHRSDIYADRHLHIPLSSGGIIQAGHVGQAFVKLGLTPDRVYTAPARRTRQTADACLAAMELSEAPVYTAWDLAERHYGDWAKRSRHDVVTTAIAQQYQTVRPPGGESEQDFQLRCLRWLDQECTPESDVPEPPHQHVRPEIILAFAHSSVISAIVGGLRGVSTHERISHASIARVMCAEELWRVDFIGRRARDLVAACLDTSAAPDHR